MSYPKLIYDIDKLKNNINIIGKCIHDSGCSMMIVTKSFCAELNIAEIIDKHPLVDYIADSRVKNLKKMKDFIKPKVLLRIPQKSELNEMIKYADISFQSEPDTLIITNEVASKIGKVHKVVLMIDLGDLREGIFYENRDEIMSTIKLILDSPNLELFGIATNLSCFGAIIPKEDNLSILAKIAHEIEDKFFLKLKMVSGGNSSSYYLADQGNLPNGINNLRLGEAFILGNDTAYGTRIKDTFNDGVILQAQIVELKLKPSVPIGESGSDAFGNKPIFEDRGIIKRAILALGQQDTDRFGIYPIDPDIVILGASSDHMILDVTKSKNDYHVGDILSFKLNYLAHLKLTTSEYVTHEYIMTQKSI